MIITLNQKEIEKMILTGLGKMGIKHKDAVITMVAGRSPAGMTAEVKLVPAETQENILKDIVTDVSQDEEPKDVKVDGTAPLFGKTSDAKTA